MRVIALASILGLAVGCSTGQGSFQYESSMYDDTRGVAFTSDDTVQAGMFGNTCEVDVGTAVIGQDVDVAANDDYVVDAHNGIVLVKGDTGVHLYEPLAFDFFESPDNPDIPGSGVVDAGLIDGGVATVSNTNAGIEVGWGEIAAPVAVPGSQVAGFAVDRTTGTTFVVADGEVNSATVDGQVTAIGSGDMASWDDVAQVLYVAEAGGSELVGYEADGGLRFALPVEGQIVALDALDGQALVSVERRGTGALLVVDGDSGLLVDEQATPSAADELQASESGRSVAITVGNELMFFRIRN